MIDQNGEVIWMGEREPDEAFEEMSAAAAELVIGTIVYERVRAEREAAERALALLNEGLDKMIEEHERHWMTRLARWWRQVWKGE